jgi:hypothetical protein
MNVSPSNVPGMGPIKFPSGGEFGSGDIPVSLNKIYKFSDYIDIVFPKKKKKKEDLNEESMMDRIQSQDKSRSPERQYSDYVKAERKKYNEWLKARKAHYIEKFKDAKTPEEKKIIKKSV